MFDPLNDPPRTIEELKKWYRAHRLPPPDKTRFFIGVNYQNPRAFGIYKDENGDFIVYKNKANGERAVRYQGSDEEYAVSELYEKLKEEILKRKRAKLSSRTIASATESPSRADSHGVFPPLCIIIIFVSILVFFAAIGIFQHQSGPVIRCLFFAVVTVALGVLSRKENAITTPLFILLFLVNFLVICYSASQLFDRNGYYSHEGDSNGYYRQGKTWYYCIGDGDWQTYYGSTEDFDYEGYDYYSVEYPNRDSFSDSPYYKSRSSHSSSDHDHGWDNDSDWDDDDWDFGDTDWDSDW